MEKNYKSLWAWEKGRVVEPGIERGMNCDTKVPWYGEKIRNTCMREKEMKVLTRGITPG